jgi:uncharacterized protein (TIGR03086 family)
VDLIQPLADTFDHSVKVLLPVEPDMLDAPTPCTDWDMRTLLTHMFNVVENMGHGARDEPLVPEADLVLEAGLAAQFRRLADGTLAAWRARHPEDAINVGGGPMPVQVAMSINLLDTGTHAWDIARSTGQDPQLPESVASTLLALCHRIVPDENRERAGFAPQVAVPADASSTDRLVAFLGRQP